MALDHKWDVKNDFAYVLQFFSLISDSLGSVRYFILAHSYIQTFVTIPFEGKAAFSMLLYFIQVIARKIREMRIGKFGNSPFSFLIQ